MTITHFSPGEAYIFLRVNLQLLNHLILILDHPNHPLTEVLLNLWLVLWWVFEWVIFLFYDLTCFIIFDINMVICQIWVKNCGWLKRQLWYLSIVYFENFLPFFLTFIYPWCSIHFLKSCICCIFLLWFLSCASF